MEFWNEMLIKIIVSILAPLVTLAVGLIARYLVVNIKNERIQNVIFRVEEIAKMAVAETAQSFVDELKKNGDFTKEKAEEALNKSLALTKQMLGQKGEKLVKMISDDVEAYLKALIEQQVRLDKK